MKLKFSRQSLGKRCAFVLEFENKYWSALLGIHWLKLHWNRSQLGPEEHEVFSAVLKVL